jgi:hypothetical protein
MDRYTMMVALSGQICGTILIISLVGAWLGRRKSAALPKDVMQRIDLRLTEMQQSLDAVAVEVERISEGQRFATKLLAERGGAAGDEVNVVREAIRGGPTR